MHGVRALPTQSETMLRTGTRAYPRSRRAPYTPRRVRLLRSAALVTFVAAIASLGVACEGILGLSQATVIVGDGGLDAAGGGDATASDGGGSNEGGSGDSGSTGTDSSAGGDSGGGPSDGGSKDAPTPTDDGGIGEPSLPCAQQPTADLIFCADFDESDDAGAGWNPEQITGSAGTFDIDTSNPSSSPNSVQFVAFANESGYAYLQLQLPQPLNEWVHLAFDFRLDSPVATALTGAPYVVAAQLIVGAFDLLTNYTFETTGDVIIQESSQVMNKVGMPLPPYQAWTRIVIEYDVTKGTSVYEDGVLEMSDPSSVGIALGTPTIAVGAVDVTPGSGSSSLVFEIDNVVVHGQ
jgi:hypothetical protein